MKNKKNPLIMEDSSSGKLFFRWFFIVLYILYLKIFFRLIHDILNLNNISFNEKSGVISNIIFFILFSLFVFKRLLNKKSRNSMRVMKHICSYDEVYSFLETQTFEEVRDIGYEKIYESELWLKISGVFVPKNFIVSAYYVQKMRGNYLMCIVLVNGTKCFYDIGVHSENGARTFGTFAEMIQHGDFNHINDWCEGQGRIRKILKGRYEKYITEGHTVESLINNYVDFTEGIWDEKAKN